MNYLFFIYVQVLQQIIFQMKSGEKTTLKKRNLYQNNTNNFLFSYPCWMTTHLLLNCGAYVDIFDINRNTPLHRLVQNSLSIDIIMIINILCNFGAHLDYVNNQGQIPLELIGISQNEIIRYLKEKMGVRRLKCICARLIQKESLQYQNLFSTSLISFTQKH